MEEGTCSDLLQAARGGHAKRVVELLEKPHDPDADRNRQVTPLVNASANGHLKVVLCLLDVGADKEKVDFLGATPLRRAAEQGHAVVQCLPGIELLGRANRQSRSGRWMFVV